ncbi:MAG: tetratricopeptide repeat protein [Gammaproteobacteria bacterium]
MTSAADIQRGLQAYAQAQALHRERKYAQAAELYKRALACMPDHPHVIAGYAQLAEDVRDWAGAEKLFRRLGTLRPDVDYQAHLGLALYRQQRFADAIPLFETHLARQPRDADVMHALATCLYATGRWEEGLARAQAAMALKPDEDRTDAVLNGLYHLGRSDELDAQLASALRQFPESRAIRSMNAQHRLKSGDHDAGFRYFADFRWRNHLDLPDDAGMPGEAWDGRRFDGTLLVVAEQGLGDEIMMSSMLEDLVAMGQRAIVECDPRLLPLFARSFPQLQFVPRHRQQLQQAFAAGGGTGFKRVNALDIGGFFRRDAARFPARARWLQADAPRAAALRADYHGRWPGKKLVGISWKSSRRLEGDADKSFALADFAPLLQRDDVVAICLQYGEVRAEIDALHAAGNGRLFVDERIDASNDIDGLAAQIAALDAVVTTSNTTAHVAGALGVPCLVLLPRTWPVLWYWGYRGERTPWYPSLRLLRNESDTDRRALLQRAATLLPDLWASPVEPVA